VTYEAAQGQHEEWRKQRVGLDVTYFYEEVVVVVRPWDSL